MREFFQDQRRVAIGGAIAAFVWIAFVLRVTLGVGPMRDPQGNPAPVLHYLVGALVVTGLVAFWIIVRCVMGRTQNAERSSDADRSGRLRGDEQDREHS